MKTEKTRILDCELGVQVTLQPANAADAGQVDIYIYMKTYIYLPVLLLQPGPYGA